MQDNINDKLEQHKGLVYKQLHKFGLVKDPDAESLGYEALYNAIVTYDNSKSVKFSTYATVCIYNALGTYVRHLNRQRQLEVFSYNNIAYSEDGRAHEFCELLEDPINVEDELCRKELCRLTVETIQSLYDNLTNEKHKRIIEEWRKSDYEISTVELANKVNVSQSYASQVLSSFKSKIKSRMEEYYNA